MKKIFVVLFAMFASLNMANAQFDAAAPANYGGGFEGPGAPSMAPITVKQALSARDDAIVVLVGKIITSLGDEKYIFADSTGEVMIEIDDEDWHGIKVTPNDTIQIVGEVDKEFMEKTKIDVKSFTVK